MSELLISSFNCNRLAEKKKRGDVFMWLADKNYDILCLQETHSTQSDEIKWKGEWGGGGEIYCSHGCSSSRGVMIMYKKKGNIMIKETVAHHTGRYIIQHILADNKDFVLMNLYAPNSDDPLFFENIINTLQEKELHDKGLIMVGDYNNVLDVHLEQKGAQNRNYHAKSYNAISGIMSSLDLIDIWRMQNPKQTRYRWRQGNQASRIDYFLTSFSLIPFIKKVEIKERFKSDHHFISLTVCTTTFYRGPGHWKLNQQLLKDKDFIEKQKDL